jgi:ATP-binding protein involved in chromosome partitioning
MTVTKEQVLERLRQIRVSGGQGDIVSANMVSEIFIADGKVFFSITVPADRAQAMEPLRQGAEEAVKTLPGVSSVAVALTAERRAGSSGNGNAHPSPPRAQPAHGQGSAPAKPGIPGIETIIAVASGKGGVGKSTTSVNLALGLSLNGLKVGILDADIYGPSMPRLLGITGRPQMIGGKTLVPMQGHGLKVMSIGFLVEEDTPMIWRGPMVISALTQMMREVAWGELDVLVVDMPPGTGDAQLTMAQQVPLAGAVIVSTPQDLALIDARKGLNMFRRVDVPVLGLIENMSYFICPDCGNRHDIFGHGGARREAERIGVPFLGEVPLQMVIRETSDSGMPVIVSEPDGQVAGIYREIAGKVWQRLQAERGSEVGPAIVFE